MDRWKFVFLALLLTLFVPAVLWGFVFATFGWWSFFLLLGVLSGLLLLDPKRPLGALLKGIFRLLLPFTLTSRYYDALVAGMNQKESKGNALQILMATLGGFLKGEEAQPTPPPPSPPTTALLPTSPEAKQPEPKVDEMLLALKEKMRKDKKDPQSH